MKASTSASASSINAANFGTRGRAAAALPGRVQNLCDSRLETVVGVGDDQLDASQAAMAQATQELAPERFGFAVASGHAEHLAAAIRVHADRDDHGDRDDVVVASDFDVGRIEPEIWPLTLDRPREEGVQAPFQGQQPPASLAARAASDRRIRRTVRKIVGMTERPAAAARDKVRHVTHLQAERP